MDRSCFNCVFSSFCFVVVLGQAFETPAQELLRVFDDPTTTQADRFGTAVSVSGLHALVGAPLDDTLAVDTGQAHLFDARTGKLIRTFENPSPAPSDGFGGSVALSKNLAVIASSGDDHNGFNVGRVYLFDIKTGEVTHTLDDPTPTSQDRFGASVALGAEHVLIGAPSDRTASSASSNGQAHLFDAETGSLLRTFDDPTLSANDSFGRDVAIFGDRVLIGARGDRSGGGTAIGDAHLFDLVTGKLLFTFNNPTPNEFDNFGAEVALNGEFAADSEPLDDTDGANRGQVHLFDLTTGELAFTFTDPTPTFADEFGQALEMDSDRLLIGSPRDGTLGIAVGQSHLFDLSSKNLIATFNDPTVTDSGLFGAAVGLGKHSVFVGAPLDSTSGFRVGQTYQFAIPEPTEFILLVIGAVLYGAQDRVSFRLDNARSIDVDGVFHFASVKGP